MDGILERVKDIGGNALLIGGIAVIAMFWFTAPEEEKTIPEIAIHAIPLAAGGIVKMVL